MSFQFPSEFPILQNSDILIRALRLSDAEALFDLRNQEIVNRYINRDPPKTLEDVYSFIQRIENGIKEEKLLYWAIDKTGIGLAGTICLKDISPENKYAEIGYELHPQFHRKGIMNQALNLVLDYAFSVLNLNDIEAFTSMNNVASIHLLLKNNFQLLPDRRDPDVPDNRIYHISRSRFSMQ